ncbi:uracil phosphoribosyltransferase [Crocinitomicaceae bacterium]|jgi:hypothetical protein|nr:uracil phosphoribosyltransferase [Crocinitomicaceae bacterium]
MSSTTIFYGIGTLFADYLFIPFEMVGNIFNYSFIVLGFVGLFYWLNMQKKFNQQAADNKDQLK